MICKYEPCSRPFEPKTPHQLFCQKICKKRYYNEILAKKRRKGNPLVVVECETKSCKNTFKQNNHRHRFCAECSRLKKLEYQRRRYEMKKAGTLPAPHEKEKKPGLDTYQLENIRKGESILCPWERGDIKQERWGGGMEYFL